MEDTQGEPTLAETSAVGVFPQGASPYGVMDMYGNVWEWCLTGGTNPQDARDPDSDEGGFGADHTAQELLVGCSWMEPSSVPVYGRSVSFGFNQLRPGTVGFRVLRPGPAQPPGG